MKVWSNTKTLDGLLSGITMTADEATAEVALIGGKPLELERFPRLRGIFKCGIGRDNVPEAEAAARGIAVSYPSAKTVQVIHEETASFTCHLILWGLYANTGDFATWLKRPRASLAEQTLLVVGVGNIGSRVAQRMSCFMPVKTFDSETDPSERLDELVATASCVSLHVPLNDETRGWWNRVRLAAMPDASLLVNTARGGIVDEEALYQELARGRLRAAFDVFWEEPYQGRLCELPATRFIRTPHVASTCNEFLMGTAADFQHFLQRLQPA